MFKENRFLAIIPARGGSKGLPGKNSRNTAGRPLMEWTIRQAQDCHYIDRICVSTDSRELADLAVRGGVDVPFLRPRELAQDHSPAFEAVLHAIDYWQARGEEFDVVMHLEPTSPLRKKGDLSRAVETFLSADGAESLVTVGEVHMEHPMIVKRLDDDGFVRPYLRNQDRIHQRQQADKAYFPYGVAYLATIDVFRQQKSYYTARTVGCPIERWQCYEVDDIWDHKIIEMILQEKINEIR